MADRTGLSVGIAAGGIVALMIFLGSQGLRHFDWALLPYAMASIFSAGAIAYRYTVWLKRPPTWRYWVQGWRLFVRRPVAHTLCLVRAFSDDFAAQRFIGRRSRVRWVMHACLSWGSLLAFGITFPLVFGWIHFETPPHDPTVYRMLVLGLAVTEFPVESLHAALVFNALNASAIMVLIGIALAVRQRMTDPGVLAVQQFGNDIIPLLLLFAVAATGLGLTVSARWLEGGFGFIALTHMAAVVAMLLYLPFGKFFHIFQRAAQLGVAVYKQAAHSGPRASCARCREPFTSRMQAEGLKQVLDDLGMDFRLQGPLTHYQEICPACRRRLWALTQATCLGR